MSVRRAQIFCQRCLASNPVEKELCERCGTRLMLVVEPTSQRFEDGAVLGCDYDEHLLERVTVLENHLARFAEKLEKTLDLLLRQARSSYLDHALLESLVSLLAATGTIKRPTLLAAWRDLCEKQNLRAEPPGPREELRERVLALGCDNKKSRRTFDHLIKNGFGRFGAGEEAEGLRELRRAAALAPSNAPLHAFVGEHCFRSGRMALAREYLMRALRSDPDDGRVRLLLGLACGDEGDWRRAKQLLTESVKRGRPPSFAAHYALGRLSAAESDWESALAHFKRALAARDCYEAHYILGVVYYQLERYRPALRHLTKAVEGAPDYGEALYVLGLVRLRLGQKDLACEAFDSAYALDPKEPRYRAARRAVGRTNGTPPPPAFLPKGRGRRGLVTGGDHRLAVALAADALGEAETLPR